MTTFKKILIANRGEIAVRIINTAKAMGYSTVAVYSEADRDALHVELADQAVLIGPAPVTESYLNANAIIAAAKLSGADAIHPGYGFLSENGAFVRLCEHNQLIFIGPPAQAIELMGSKRLSKIAVQQANVPTVPGYDGEDQSIITLTEQAQRIGLPLMIKASAGGGGRGMRLVEDFATLAGHLCSARSEAENAFGCGELILEKAIINPRHIEIQIFADQHGNVISLGERDCSIQRRHQKVVEEAPSPVVNPTLRKAMSAAAVEVARLCNYSGAGTVEFLLEQSGEFYFLEMNTRLQVEHPVTELVTGLNLVEWQLRIAASEPLPLTQQQVNIQGHAIEVRLYAEDPYQGYIPQTGPIHLWHTSTEPGVRIDSGIKQGSQISPYYDPMLAKIISCGRDRNEAINKLERALGSCILLGTQSNKYFLREILNHPRFRMGEAGTDFIKLHQTHLLQANSGSDCSTLALAAAIWVRAHSGNCSSHEDRLIGRMGSTVLLRNEYSKESETVVRCRVSYRSADDIRVSVNSINFDLNINLLGTQFQVRSEGLSQFGYYFLMQNSLYFDSGDANFHYSVVTHAAPARAELEGTGRVLSPMAGNLLAILAEPGTEVKKGDLVAIVEAMKMEHQLRAGVNGIVESVSAKVGDQLKTRQLILLIKRENNEN